MMFADPKILESQVMQILKKNQDLSEEATKQRVIEPIFAILGWHIFGNEIQREYEIYRGPQRKERVDYALLIDKKPKILIEAKKLNSDLSEPDAHQVIGYARIDKKRWCVLTNGRIWQIFDTEWGKDPDECLFREIKIEQSDNPLSQLQLISHDSIAKGKLGEAAGESYYTSKLEAYLSKVISELREEFVKKIDYRVYNKMKKEFPQVTRKQIGKIVDSKLRISVSSEEVTILPPPPEPSEYTVDYHFAGKYSSSRPIYDNFIKAVRQEVKELSIHPTKYYIALKGTRRYFAVIDSKIGYINVLIDLKSGKKTSRLGPGDYWHWSWTKYKFKIDNKEEIDSEIIGWINESYVRRGN